MGVGNRAKARSRAKKGTSILGERNLDKDVWEGSRKPECGGKPGNLDGATNGPLGLGGHRVSSGLIAMTTLDHSSCKAPAHLLSALVGSCRHRRRHKGGWVTANKEKSRATHLPGYRLHPPVPTPYAPAPGKAGLG